MPEFPDRCWHCGSERLGIQDKRFVYKCGTESTMNDGRFKVKRSGTCVEILNEQIRLLRERLKSAK